MRATLVAVIAAASMTALSSCAYAPTEPARSYSYAAPLPLAAPTPPSYRPCDRGWHWVHGRQTRADGSKGIARETWRIRNGGGQSMPLRRPTRREEANRPP